MHLGPMDTCEDCCFCLYPNQRHWALPVQCLGLSAMSWEQNQLCQLYHSQHNQEAILKNLNWKLSGCFNFYKFFAGNELIFVLFLVFQVILATQKVTWWFVAYCNLSFLQYCALFDPYFEGDKDGMAGWRKEEGVIPIAWMMSLLSQSFWVVTWMNCE